MSALETHISSLSIRLRYLVFLSLLLHKADWKQASSVMFTWEKITTISIILGFGFSCSSLMLGARTYKMDYHDITWQNTNRTPDATAPSHVWGKQLSQDTNYTKICNWCTIHQKKQYRTLPIQLMVAFNTSSVYHMSLRRNIPRTYMYTYFAAMVCTHCASQLMQNHSCRFSFKDFCVCLIFHLSKMSCHDDCYRHCLYNNMPNSCLS